MTVFESGTKNNQGRFFEVFCNFFNILLVTQNVTVICVSVKSVYILKPKAWPETHQLPWQPDTNWPNLQICKVLEKHWEHHRQWKSAKERRSYVFKSHQGSFYFQACWIHNTRCRMLRTVPESFLLLSADVSCVTVDKQCICWVCSSPSTEQIKVRCEPRDVIMR